MKLVRLHDFIERTWSGKRPDRRTVIGWFEQDELPAVALRKIGSRYFVDLDKLDDEEVDEVVQKVLHAA